MNRWYSFVSTGLAFIFAFAAQAASPQDELVAACGRGDLAAAQRLLKSGAKINDTDTEGRTPLLAALFSRKEALVSWVLKNGADPNLSALCPERQCRGHAGLVGAVRTDNPAMVRLLLNSKADVAADDNAAARQANIRGSAEILRMLRAAGGSETGATTAPSPAKRETRDPQPALSGLSELLPAGPAATRKAGAKLRVAIVAEDALRSAADLLAASLASGSFDLIERNELNRILDEHKLTAQVGADGARTAELGALLGADALVLLRKVQVGQASSAEMRFVRVSPGIVLDSVYRAWPLADAPAWAADAAARLTSLDPKFRDEHANAIATASFRPLTDSPVATSLARESLLLLNDRLAHQPGVILLERAAVDALSREQSVGKAGSFWAGSYLLDGTVEPATSDAGQIAITLRMAPIGPGEVKTFTARSPRAELPRLVRELTTQAANTLKLSALPPSDLKTEAQRHFEESRNLFAVGLLVAAHRAAETAAAFGMDTDEFTEWRLNVALKLMDWQAKMLGQNSNFYPLHLSGWSEAWIESQTNGAEWLRPVEWCDLGVQAVRFWQRLLVSALRADDPIRPDAFLKSDGPFDDGKSPLNNVSQVYESLNLAATTLDHRDMHEAIYDAVRETLEQSLALADAKQVHASSACKIAIQLARLAPKLYRDQTSLVAGFTSLLNRHFATEDSATRLAIRMTIFSLNSYPSDSFVPKTILTLRDAATRGSGVEDEITRALYECLLPKDKKQQRVLSDKLFDLLWEHRQMFVNSPTTIRFFDQICSLVSKYVADAPKFRERFVQTPVTQVHERSPEMLDLRRKLFLLVAKNAARPGPALSLWDKDYHPPGEDAEELAAANRRVQEDIGQEMVGPRRTPNPNTAPRAARPVLRGTPTYAKYPPLQVTRLWTTEPTPHGRVEDLYIDAPTFDAGANTLWLFGQFADETALHGYAFEVSLPLLKTKAWPLPPVERPVSTGVTQASNTVHLYPSSDRLYLSKAEQYLAIGDRKTREWKVNREVQPAGDFVRVGDDLFFLTRSGGARGMASLSLRDQSITIHASNRRTPPQTPLDRTDLAAVSLKAGTTGLIEITTEPFDATDDKVRMGSETKPQSVVTFDPSKRNWTEPKLAEKPPATPRTFTPLIGAGVPMVYKKQPDTNVWTMQMPRAEMPKARVPIEFIAPKDRKPLASNEASLFRRWYWTPHGYFIVESPPFDGGLVYFIPQNELDAYLDSHVPEEDETGAAPPVPTKEPTPR